MFSMLSFALRHHPRQRRNLIHLKCRRGILNQQNLYLIPPPVVSLLLQYNGSRMVHKDGFSSWKWIILSLTLVINIWILGFCKNSEL